jgi:hypothetical protein
MTNRKAVAIIAFSICVANAAQAQRVRAGRMVLLDSVVLESDQSRPLVRLAGVARHKDGRLVLADLSEANIRVHRPNGSLLHVFGRQGDGPGEFRAPASPVIDQIGRIHVVDLLLKRITVFSSGSMSEAPRLIRTIPVDRAVPSIMSFSMLTSGQYVISGTGAASKNVIFRLDSTGALIDASLPIGNYRRAQSPLFEDGVWRALTIPTVIAMGNDAVVALSTFDSLWTLNWKSAPRAERIPYEGYRIPTLPQAPLTSRESLRQWARSQMVTSVIGSDAVAALPFFSGTYNEGVHSDVMLKDRGGWTLVKSTPTVLLIVQDTVYSIRSVEDPIRLIRWRVQR